MNAERGPAAVRGRPLAARLRTAAVGLPIAAASIWVGGYAYFALLAVVAVAAWAEYAALLRTAGARLPTAAGMAASVGLLAAAYLWGPAALAPGLFAAVGAAAAAAVAGAARGTPEGAGERTRDLLLTVAGLVWLPWLLAHAVALRGLATGRELTVLLFLTVWANDSFAYFVGSAVGRTPLAPAISPRKTVEGAAAGLAAAAAVGAAAAGPLLGLPVVHGAAAAAVTAVAGQVGDLLESGVKRYCRAKDSGAVVPGHGGALDRFDSLLLAAPALYYLATLLGAVQRAG